MLLHHRLALYMTPASSQFRNLNTSEYWSFESSSLASRGEICFDKWSHDHRISDDLIILLYFYIYGLWLCCMQMILWLYLTFFGICRTTVWFYFLSSLLDFSVYLSYQSDEYSEFPIYIFNWYSDMFRHILIDQLERIHGTDTVLRPIKL